VAINKYCIIPETLHSTDNPPQKWTPIIEQIKENSFEEDFVIESLLKTLWEDGLSHEAFERKLLLPSQKIFRTICTEYSKHYEMIKKYYTNEKGDSPKKKKEKKEKKKKSKEEKRREEKRNLIPRNFVNSLIGQIMAYYYAGIEEALT